MKSRLIRVLLPALLLGVPFRLAPQGTAPLVTFDVRDPGGQAVLGARIRLVPSPDPEPAKSETDTSGRLAVHLKPGGYALFVTAQGFRTVSMHVEVRETPSEQFLPVSLQVGPTGSPYVYPERSVKDGLRVDSYPYHEPPIVFSLAELRAFPHVTLTVHNPHSNTDETYSGVPLAALLAKANAPLGRELRGITMSDSVYATGTDGYQAFFSLAEIDPEFHQGQIIVADTMNGQPLDARSGPLKLVVTDDKRPARSVRNLASITLRSPAAAFAPPPATTIPVEKKNMTTRATGTFDVKLAPQAADDYADSSALGRMTIDKQFHGDLEATSKGQMLTGMSALVKGSGAYVAIERVTGKLAGRSGTFILYHVGTMDHGAPSLSVTVVPDSGTGELTGLTGKMEIIVASGKHSYNFDYSLPAQ